MRSCPEFCASLSTHVLPILRATALLHFNQTLEALTGLASLYGKSFQRQ